MATTVAAAAGPAVASGPPSASPSGRIYEMVSPPDKNFSDISYGQGTVRSSVDGSRVRYESKGAFNDPEGGPFRVDYIADRGVEAWDTFSLSQLEDPQIFPATTGTYGRSRAYDLELERWIFSAPSLPPTGETSGVRDLYLGTVEPNPSFSLLTASVGPLVPTPADEFGYFPDYVDATPSFDHVVFETAKNLTPEASGSAKKVYEWDSGTVRLVSVAPTGLPASGSSGARNTRATFAYMHNIVSDDGERILFTNPQSPSTGRAYLREGGGTPDARTIWISQSEATTPDPTPQPADILDASDDVTRVFFTTSESLVDADQNPSGTDAASRDLYLYTHSPNPETDSNLTLVSVDQEPVDGVAPEVEGVLGASSDGSVVYFAARGQLLPGEGASAVEARPNVYRWEQGSLSYVATLGSSQDVDNYAATANSKGRRVSRVTQDGRFLSFVSYRAGGGGAAPRDLFVYDALTEDLSCASCIPDGQGGAVGGRRR